MLDSGLLSNFLGKETQVSIISKTIKGNTKGGVYENVIDEELTKRNYNIFYYKKNDSTIEIEFLIEKNGDVIPIEVKGSNNGTIPLN